MAKKVNLLNPDAVRAYNNRQKKKKAKEKPSPMTAIGSTGHKNPKESNYARNHQSHNWKNQAGRNKTVKSYYVGAYKKQRPVAKQSDSHKSNSIASNAVKKQQIKSYNSTSGGRFTQGFVKNSLMMGLPQDSTATYKDSNNKRQKVAESKAYKAGEILGDLVSYGTGYGLAGKAITRATGKAVAKQALKEGAEQATKKGALGRAEDWVATKAGQAILKSEGKAAEKIASTKAVEKIAAKQASKTGEVAKMAGLAKSKDAVKKDIASKAARKISQSVIADATAGTALDTAHAHGEGIDIGFNKQYLSYMGTNALLNLSMGAGMEGLSAGAKKIVQNRAKRELAKRAAARTAAGKSAKSETQNKFFKEVTEGIKKADKQKQELAEHNRTMREIVGEGADNELAKNSTSPRDYNRAKKAIDGNGYKDKTLKEYLSPEEYAERRRNIKRANNLNRRIKHIDADMREARKVGGKQVRELSNGRNLELPNEQINKLLRGTEYAKENNIKFSDVLEQHNGNRAEAIEDLYNRSVNAAKATEASPVHAETKQKATVSNRNGIEPSKASLDVDDVIKGSQDEGLTATNIADNDRDFWEWRDVDTEAGKKNYDDTIAWMEKNGLDTDDGYLFEEVHARRFLNEKQKAISQNAEGAINERSGAEDFGEFKSTERPTRPTGDSGEVSQAAETIRDSNIQTEESRKRAQEIIDEGLRNKRFKSNKKAIEEAETKIRERGVDHVAKTFEDNVDDGFETTSERIVEAYVCYKHYIDNGEFAKANELGERIVITESEHGRALQAMRLFSSLAPEGRVRSIQRMLRKLNKQRGTDAKVSDELYKALRDAKTDTELINANNAISKHVWDQIPANWVEKLNAWRYLAMLGNPKTHGRNVVGNIVFYPVRAMRDVMATGMEKAALKTKKGSELLTGERTKAILTGSREDKELVRMGKDSFNSGVGEILRGNAKYLDTSDGMTLAVRPHESQVFNTKWLDWLRKKNGERLDKEDLTFMRPTYAKSYASYLKANGYTAKTATEEVLKKAQDYASRQALEATYRDYNFLSTKLNKYKRYANTPLKDIPANSQSPDAERLFKKAAGIGVEALAPFTKTPINILRRGADFSPIGLAQGVGKLMKANSADELVRGIEKLSSGLTGTGIMALGYSLGHMGIATGSLDYTDKKDVYAQTMGKQAYSIEIGDNSFTIDTLAPVSMPFFVGVELAKSNDEEGSLAAAFSSFDKITDPVFNLSMLSSLNTAFSNKYSSGNSVMEVVRQSGESYLGQYLPTILSQAARTRQKETTGTMATDSNTTIRNYHRFINQMKNKVPFLADTNAPKVDQWGRTETKEDAMDYATAAFQNFVNPSNYKRIKTNKADKEIQKLLEQGADASVIPNSKPQSYKVVFGNKEVQMSADDVANMQKKVGRTALKSLKELFDSDAYKNMALEEKEKAVSNVYTDAKSIAKHEFLINKGYSPVSVAWKLDLNDDQRDGFGSKAEFKKALKKANITAEEYSKLAQEGMTPSKLKSANSKGISAKAFLGYTKLKAEDKGGYASQAMYLYRNGLAKDADSAYENYDIRKATYEAAVQMVDAGYTEDEIYELTGNVDDVVKDIKENYGHDTWSNGVEVVSAEGLKKYLDSRKELTDNDRHNLWYIYGLGHDWFKARNPY